MQQKEKKMYSHQVIWLTKFYRTFDNGAFVKQSQQACCHTHANSNDKVRITIAMHQYTHRLHKHAELRIKEENESHL